MHGIRWPVLATAASTRVEFVLFWDRLYTGYNEDFYQENIGQPLTPERIASWYAWKNGTTLSAAKKEAVRRYAAPEERIDSNADSDSLEDFLSRPGGAIWRIFWLHLQHPSAYPIYDQHVHRAMAFLQNLPSSQVPVRNPEKVRTYLSEYRPFFRTFGGCDPRQTDRALWAFGRFLKSEYGSLLAAPSP